MKSYESIPLSLGIFYVADGDFEKGLLSVINIGDDAETNGAIVGALCGAYCGSKNIKHQWINQIMDVNMVDFKGIAEALLENSKK